VKNLVVAIVGVKGLKESVTLKKTEQEPNYHIVDNKIIITADEDAKSVKKIYLIKESILNKRAICLNYIYIRDCIDIEAENGFVCLTNYQL